MMTDIHTMPIADLVDHDYRRDCWCQPEALTPCYECLTGRDEIVQPNPDCWRCDGTGLIEWHEGMPCMVVHNAADGRE